jgi:hypothetical protein
MLEARPEPVERRRGVAPDGLRREATVLAVEPRAGASVRPAARQAPGSEIARRNRPDMGREDDLAH